MKTERRHELQTNELANWLGNATLFVERNARAVVGGVVALAIILIAYFYLTSESEAKRSAGWDQYFRAMQTNDVTELNDIVTNFDGSPVAAWSRLALADDNLIAGTNDLFTNRAIANDRLRAAATDYEEVVRSSAAAKEQLLKQRATMGLARTYESLNELGKARELYWELADEKRWEPPLYAAMSAQRLANLDQASTKEFYDWFARLQPTPATAAPGTPLDLEKLPDEPPASGEAQPEAKADATDAVPPASTSPESAATEPSANAAAPVAEAAAETPAAEATPTEPAPAESEPAPAEPSKSEANPATP